MEEAIERLSILAKIQLQTGNADVYNLGLYNGILTSIAILSGIEARLLKLEEFKKLKEQLFRIGFNK